MERDTVVRLGLPGSSIADDPLLLVLRDGARRMLQQVIEAEVETFLSAHAELEDVHGRRRVVRNGHAPEREIQIGIGSISVRRPKLRDRGDGAGGARIRFTLKVLPPFLRRTKNVEELLPWLYLKGVSTGQFDEALTALLGPDAPGLSASTVRRLVAAWQQEHERWQHRDLCGRRFVYIWADGVYFTPRLDHDRQCLLVVIGADGNKELLAIEDGFRESAQSWRELLIRLRDENGLKVDPELATGDGGLGFWKALHEIWPKTRQQRCWVHKTANVLNKLPSSVQGKAKKDLHAIYPIESTFATVRLRTDKTKVCLSRDTELAMVFKLAKSAERHWRKLDGANRLGQLIQGVKFGNGEPVQDAEEKATA